MSSFRPTFAAAETRIKYPGFRFFIDFWTHGFKKESLSSRASIPYSNLLFPSIEMVGIQDSNLRPSAPKAGCLRRVNYRQFYGRNRQFFTTERVNIDYISLQR
jgi:hypothetical protein